MSRALRLAILLCCSLLGMSLAVAALPGLFSEDLDTALYDCTLELTPAAGLSAGSAATLTFEAVDTKNCSRLILTKKSLTLEAFARGKRVFRQELDSAITAGEVYRLSILRRADRIALLHDDALLFRGKMPRASGNEAGLVVETGWTLKDVRVQRLEPVNFADNFMRTKDEDAGHSLWTTVSGAWGLLSAWDTDPHGNTNRFAYAQSGYGQNPFAWRGTAEKDGTAFCVTGKPFWEDYTFTAAVRPGAGGAIGIAANMTDPRNGLLARWTPASDRTTRGNSLTLYKLVDGEQALLGKARGGFIPGQWYKLTIVSDLEGVSVQVDGEERINVKNVSPWRGGVGLYTEGANGALFDDITVYGRTLNKDLITENLLSALTDRIRNDDKGMQEWSTLRSDWTISQMSPGDPTYGKETCFHRLDFYGDHRLTTTVVPRISKAGKLLLCLCGNGRDLISGYRAVIEHTTNPAKTTATLYRDTTEVGTKLLDTLETGTEYTVRLSRVGSAIVLDVDGDPVLTYTDPKPLTGQRPAYYAEGNLAPVRKALVISANMLDYLFADAPTDWVSDGAWAPTTRWSCSPNWSFLAGYSRGNAVLWHKKRFTGDHTFEAFLGLKMEYPREREIYDNRYRSFAVTICGDGSNPLSGYTGVFGAPDETGAANRRSVLLRNGVEVGSATVTVPGRGAAHREWFDLMLKKRGNVVEFYIEGRLAITYTDPKPIAGGVPAAWTSDNCISMARARVLFANPPEHRQDPTVLIDTPWFPEWANVGAPIALSFPDSWSTTGYPVYLEAKAKLMPTDDPQANIALPITDGYHIATPKPVNPKAADVLVDGMDVVVTPKVSGEHWYEITANDGENVSEPFHLSFHAFNPALGRDDSHALVLYRFDEGSGETIHDYSKIGPPLDLAITNPNAARWVPGQGLTQMSIADPIMSMKTATKLMGIAQTKQCTVEAWISTDTIYPPTGWIGCVLAVESTGVDKRNFALGHQSSNLVFSPRVGSTSVGDNRNLIAAGFRTSLQHYVVTWDGTTTYCYINGKKVAEKVIAWQPEAWTRDAMLTLGNQLDLGRAYLGTYYLVAIHDRCFSEDEVRNNYEAGPSANRDPKKAPVEPDVKGAPKQ